MPVECFLHQELHKRLVTRTRMLRQHLCGRSTEGLLYLQVLPVQWRKHLALDVRPPRHPLERARLAPGLLTSGCWLSAGDLAAGLRGWQLMWTSLSFACLCQNLLNRKCQTAWSHAAGQRLLESRTFHFHNRSQRLHYSWRR